MPTHQLGCGHNEEPPDEYVPTLYTVAGALAGALVVAALITVGVKVWLTGNVL